jgi:hypothetical protein
MTLLITPTALVVRALEDRPPTISTAAGGVGEVLDPVAPRAVEPRWRR